MITSLDLETHLIQPGLLTPPIVCGSIATEGTKNPGMLLTKVQALAAFKRELLNVGMILAGANLAYDFGCVCAEQPELIDLVFRKYERGEVHDILIAQALDAIFHGYMQDGQILDPRTGQQIRTPSPDGKPGKISNRYSMAVVGDLTLGIQAKKNDAYRLSYALLEDKPHAEWPPTAAQYPVDDAVNGLNIALFQVKNNKNLHDMTTQARAAWCEHLMAVWGIRTDPARVAALEVELETKYTELMAKVQKLGVHRPDGTKDTKVLKALVNKAYLGSPPLTGTGEISTARDVLKDSGDEGLESFTEVSYVEKMKGTYLEFVKSGTKKPINVMPNVLLANGRSSYDGLIQLLPRKGGIRGCFCARPGYVWCSVDYSAIEMATLAQVCLWTVGHSRLADAINDGKDAHTLFTASMYGASYDDVIKIVKSDPIWTDRRQMNKAADFGFPGGMGAYKFAQSKRKEGLKLCLAARIAEVCSVEKINTWNGREYPVPACKACVEQADVLRKAYLEMWPEVPDYFGWIKKTLEEQDNKLVQFVSERVRGGLDFTSGANTLFSGLACDGAKRALWDLSKECYTDRSSPLWGSRPVIFAHDEIIVEIPETDHVHEAAWRHCEIMIKAMQACTPDVMVTAEPALMHHWDKDAKLKTGKDGRLIAWN